MEDILNKIEFEEPPSVVKRFLHNIFGENNSSPSAVHADPVQNCDPQQMQFEYYENSHLAVDPQNPEALMNPPAQAPSSYQNAKDYQNVMQSDDNPYIQTGNQEEGLTYQPLYNVPQEVYSAPSTIPAQQEYNRKAQPEENLSAKYFESCSEADSNGTESWMNNVQAPNLYPESLPYQIAQPAENAYSQTGAYNQCFSYQPLYSVPGTAAYSAPPSYVIPAQPEYNCSPQPVENLNNKYYLYNYLVADPNNIESSVNSSTQAANLYQDQVCYKSIQIGDYLYNNAAAYNQDQNMPLVIVPKDQEIKLPSSGLVNGDLVYTVPSAVRFTSIAPLATAAPPQNTSMTKKRKRASHEDGPYIKKPPNAFMLFMKEQRPHLFATKKLDSAAVNTILGKKWRAMSRQEQAKYYEQADEESRIHAEQFPGWSTRDNYGKKRKRIRRKGTITS